MVRGFGKELKEILIQGNGSKIKLKELAKLFTRMELGMMEK